MSRFRAAAARTPASSALAVALAGVAFGAGGGLELGRATVVELLLVAVGGGVVALAIWRGELNLARGGAVLGLFGVLAVVTALSVSWSIAPSSSLEEAGRTFAYLAVFAAGLALAQMRPRMAPELLAGILIATTAVCAWALATRVFPSTLAEQLFGARLGAPFDYWNALGSMGAMGLVPALYLGTREGSRSVVRALAFPAAGLLVLTILLTQSRGALAAALVAVAIWLAIVPRRLRTLPVLLLPALAAVPVAVWALSKPAFKDTLAPLATRQDIAAELGVAVLALIVVLVIAGIAVEALAQRVQPSLRLRRRIGIAAIAALLLVPVAGVVSLAVSERGLTGSISDGVGSLTDPDDAPPTGAERFSSVSSSRATYWGEAREAFEDEPLVGAGAGAFAIARLRHREDARVAAHAHGYLPQTAADLGLVGIFATLSLLVAWLLAVCSRNGPLRSRGSPESWDGGRLGALALFLCVVAFGLHSAIDWIWFVPGPTVVATLAAGCLAGLPRPGEQAPAAPRTGLRRLAAAGVILTTAITAWAVWQPERGARATSHTLDLLERGDAAGALDEARRAREIAPYSPEPLWAKARALTALDRRLEAHRALSRAALEHPRDPAAWSRLAEFELEVLDLPERTLETVQRGLLRADPRSSAAVRLTARARDAAAATAALRN